MSDIAIEANTGFKMTEVGILPHEWNVARFRDIATTVTDYVANGSFASLKENVKYLDKDNYAILLRLTDHSNNYNGDFIYIDENAYNFLKKTKLQPNDIILANVGARLGTVFRVPNIVKPMSLGPNAILIRCGDHNDFLYYWLKSEYGLSTIWSIASKTAQPKFNKTDLKNVLIPLPPLHEQKRIAAVLSAVEGAKEKTDNVISGAKELKKSLMKYLFTYGAVPVEEAEKVPLAETEIGMLPDYWKVVRLGAVISEGIKNGAFIRRESMGKGKPFLNVADIYKSTVADLQKVELAECSKQDMNSYQLKENDVLYVRSSLKRDGIGQCCIVEQLYEPSFYDCHLMRVRVNKTIMMPKFLAYYSLSPNGKNELIASSKTTTMTTINQLGLKDFLVPLPTITEQQRISKTLSMIEDKMEKEEKNRAVLDALFKTLLHNLMTGKVRVNDLEV